MNRPQLTRTTLAAGLAGAIGAAAPAAAQDLAEVSLRLAWIENVQAAAYIVALEKGFYEEEGLAVEIYPGGPNINSAAMVAAGQHEFGTNDTAQVIFGKAQGMDLVTIATCFHKHPAGVLVLADSGIREPADLVGRTLAYNEGGPWTFTQAMLAKQGVDVEDVDTVVAIGNEVLMNGTVDAKTAFVVNEPIAVELAGFETHVLVPYDYGVRAAAEAIFATADFIDEHPEVVRGFLAATVRGYEYAYANREEALEIVLARNDQLDPEQQRRQLDRQYEHIFTEKAEADGVCSFTEEDIAETQDILLEYGGLETPVDVSEIADPSFLPEN